MDRRVHLPIHARFPIRVGCFSVSALAPHGSYASILEEFLDFLDAIRGDLGGGPGILLVVHSRVL